VCTGKSCSRETCHNVVDRLDARIQLRDDRRLVIRDRHNHRSGGSANVIVHHRGLGQEPRREQHGLGELRRLVGLDDVFAETFVGGSPHSPPSTYVAGVRKNLCQIRSEIGLQWPIVLKGDCQAVAENPPGDNVAWAARVDPCTAIQQICRGLLAVKYDDQCPAAFM
jgi:hypothetical protein